MSKNGGTVGFIIKCGAISAVVVGVLSYFGVVDVNDQRIKSKLDSAERFIAGLFGEAENTVDDVVGDAKREIGGAANAVEGTVKGAVDNAEDVVDDAADAVKDGAQDVKSDAQKTVNQVTQ